MERRGLVRREETTSDGRGSFVLADAGLRAIQEAAPAHVESARRHMVDLSSAEQVQVLGDIAERVVGHLGGLDTDADAEE